MLGSCQWEGRRAGGEQGAWKPQKQLPSAQLSTGCARGPGDPEACLTCLNCGQAAEGPSSPSVFLGLNAFQTFLGSPVTLFFKNLVFPGKLTSK